MLEHEGLEVYQVALDFLVAANAVIEGLPRGRGHLSAQFTRASLSMVLNIAEGAGKYSKPDKRRDYLTRRGSATESAALLAKAERSRGLPRLGSCGVFLVVGFQNAAPVRAS